jgi:hypothetical protein
MSDASNLPRRYDERQVAKILERATELQRQEPARAAGGGLSLGELEEIAIEAGIDPHHLRRAALELDTGEIERSLGARLAGEQLTLAFERLVPGELPDDGFERCVSVIQQHSREHGQPGLLGRTLTWRAETASKARSIQVTVGVRRGETHVRVEERLHQLASGLITGTTVGGGVGVGVGVGLPLGLKVLGSVLFATAFPLGFAALTFVVAREIYRRVVRTRRAALLELLDAVVEEVEASIRDGTAEPGNGPLELPRG